MNTKICVKCGIEKPLEDFKFKKDKNGKYYKYSYCKQCDYIYNKKYRKKYYALNKERIKEKHKKYNEEHKEKLELYYTKYNNEYLKKWREEHPNNVKKHIKNMSNKIKENPLLKLKNQSRDVIRNAFRRKGFLKNTKTQKILGCDYATFIEHLLQTFKNNYGYEWNGTEKVHIDHIVPLATAKTEKEIIELCNYQNLQLLKAKDNLQKGKKTNYKIVYNSKEI